MVEDSGLFQILKDQLLLTNKPGDKILAGEIGVLLSRRGEDIFLNTNLSISGRSILPEFPLRDKLILESYGGIFYRLEGLSIEGQLKARDQKGLASFSYIVDASDEEIANGNGKEERNKLLSTGAERLLAKTSLLAEVCIFPLPKKFFVPDTFGKGIVKVKEQALRFAQELRFRYGLSNIDLYLPQAAATLTEVTFLHHEATNKWLFSKEYGDINGVQAVYGLTENPTNQFGSRLAMVGDAHFLMGLDVDDFSPKTGNRYAGMVRILVATPNV